jgi:acetyl-CoA acyltransferase
MKKLYETHSMPQTADNVAAEFNIAAPTRTPSRCARSSAGRPPRRRPLQADELVPVLIPRKKGDPKVFDTDEHPRPETTLEMLAKLKGVNGPN